MWGIDPSRSAWERARRRPAPYWQWTEQEWTTIVGEDQYGFRAPAPGWADEAVRPHLAAHAFLLGGFTAFHRLGSFSRLALSWRVRQQPSVRDG
jgi:hypothetical protein